jgi:hypothetical protein
VHAADCCCCPAGPRRSTPAGALVEHAILWHGHVQDVQARTLAERRGEHVLGPGEDVWPDTALQDNMLSLTYVCSAAAYGFFYLF